MSTSTPLVRPRVRNPLYVQFNAYEYVESKDEIEVLRDLAADSVALDAYATKEVAEYVAGCVRFGGVAEGEEITVEDFKVLAAWLAAQPEDEDSLEEAVLRTWCRRERLRPAYEASISKKLCFDEAYYAYHAAADDYQEAKAKLRAYLRS